MSRRWTALPYALGDVAEPTCRRLEADRRGSGRARLCRAPFGPARRFASSPAPRCPSGADTIVIQEDTERDGDLRRGDGPGRRKPGHVRKRGIDFAEGSVHCSTPAARLTAARRHACGRHGSRETCRSTQSPVVAILATGDELVLPGEPAGPDQIVCSNPFGIAAMVRRAGGEPVGSSVSRRDDRRRSHATKIEQRPRCRHPRCHRRRLGRRSRPRRPGAARHGYVARFLAHRHATPANR